MDPPLIIPAVATVTEVLGIWLAMDAVGRGQIGLDQLAQNANDAMRPWRIDMPLVEREHKGAMQIVADRLTTTSWTRGNRTTLLVDAHATHDVLESALGSATQQACVQFYIVRSDTVGQRLQSAMLRAAARGVKVLFLVDDVGSLSLAHKYIEGLEHGGVQCAHFSPRRILNPFHRNFRNHRKVVVVDGNTALVGETNIGSEHLAPIPPLVSGAIHMCKSKVPPHLRRSWRSARTGTRRQAKYPRSNGKQSSAEATEC